MREPEGEADRFELNLNAPFRAARESLSVLGLVQSAAGSPVLGSRCRFRCFGFVGRLARSVLMDEKTRKHKTDQTTELGPHNENFGKESNIDIIFSTNRV